MTIIVRTNCFFQQPLVASLQVTRTNPYVRAAVTRPASMRSNAGMSRPGSQSHGACKPAPRGPSCTSARSAPSSINLAYLYLAAIFKFCDQISIGDYLERPTDFCINQ